MAKYIDSIRTGPMCSTHSGTLVALHLIESGVTYHVKDDAVPGHFERKSIALPDLVLTDTIGDWWDAVVQAVHDAESLTVPT